MARQRTPQPQSDFAPWTNPEAQPLVSFRGVTKRFGDFTAIDRLDIDIYEREFFALLGPSGCGKTTIMRLLAGFEVPNEGEIRLDGEDIAGTPPYRRPINMMFQSYALFPHMTVASNIAFGLRQAGWEKDRAAARVEEMLDLVRLGAMRERKPHQLSGGQQQRVALARSLALSPRLLLLDEPLGALDRKLREDTQFELIEIQERLGMTFVIVTHDQEEAMTVATRIAVMDQGRIVQIDTPGEIYEAPADRYVADFIGDLTMIEGQLKRIRGKPRLQWSEGEVPLALAGADDIEAGATCWLALRPEKVEISKTKPRGRAGEERNALAGRVFDIAYVGNLSTYHVKLENGLTIKAQEANRSRLANRAITWEDEVWVHWAADAGVVLKS